MLLSLNSEGLVMLMHLGLATYVQFDMFFFACESLIAFLKKLLHGPVCQVSTVSLSSFQRKGKRSLGTCWNPKSRSRSPFRRHRRRRPHHHPCCRRRARRKRGICRVLSSCPPKGIPKVVGFGLGCAEIRSSKVQTTQDLDRFRPQYA
jgi:hypothetical protein